MGSNPTASVDTAAAAGADAAEHSDYHDHVGFPLSNQEEEVYTALWGQVDKEAPGTSEESATAASVALFLKTSKLPSKVLKRIWDLSDTGELGRMGKQEFFVACKLIAVAQSGAEPDIERLTHATPLPILGDTTEQPPAATAAAGVQPTRISTLDASSTLSAADDNPFGTLAETSGLGAAAGRSKSLSVKNARSVRRKPTRKPAVDREGTLRRRQQRDRLCLTAEEDHAYANLWTQAMTAAGVSEADTLPAVPRIALAGFLQSSGLNTSVVDTVWALADVSAPSGALCRDEFDVFLKAVALVQAEHEATPSALSRLTPLPRIGTPIAAAPSIAVADTNPSRDSASAAGPRPGFGNLFGGAIPTLPSKSKKKAPQAPPPKKNSPQVARKPSPQVARKPSPQVARKPAPKVADKAPSAAKPSQLGASSTTGQDLSVSPIAVALGLSLADLEVYDALWTEAETEGGVLPAGVAVKFLGSSGLDKRVLKSIWALADADKPHGSLSKPEFHRACKYVAMAQAGLALPQLDRPETAAVPTPLPRLGSRATVESAPPGMVAALGLTAADVTAYERLWAEADTNGGYLAAGAAVAFLKTSGLGKTVLRTIWSLADHAVPRGQLDKDEFFLACKLVAMAQVGLAVDGDGVDRAAATPLPRLGSCPGTAVAPAAAADLNDPDLPHIAKTLGLQRSDVEHYNRLWIEADTNGGYLAAGAAVAFLGTSGLDKPLLRTIWSLADTGTPRGQLDKDEFFLASKLVAIAQAGLPVETTAHSVQTPLPRLGSMLRDSATAVASEPQDGSDGRGLPHIAKTLGLSADDVAAYDRLWAATESDGGFIAATAAATFLGTSGLGKAVLREIWELSDTAPPRGSLDRDEFFVACKLVAMAQAGISLAGTDRSVSTPLPRFGH